MPPETAMKPPSSEDKALEQFVRMVMAFVAEIEREKIMDRVMTGRLNKAREGKIMGGRKLPYGWKWQYDDNGDKDIVIHHSEQVCHVRWMCDQYDTGSSTMEISRQLSNEHIPAPDGGELWHPYMVRRILSDERLIGKGKNFAYQQKAAKQPFAPIDLPDNTYPPIIEAEQFYRMRDRLSRTSNEAPRNNERPEEFLLRAGYVKCGYCGRSMQSHIDRRKRITHPGEDVDRFVYRCNRRDRQGRVICQIGQDVLSKIVDEWVEKQLVVLAEHTELIAYAIELASNEDNLQSDARSIEASLETWQKRAQNYVEDLADPTLRGDSRASIRQSLNNANKRIEELHAERNQVLLGLVDREREQAAYAEILAWCERVRKGGNSLSYQHKRDFLHLLGVIVTVKNKGNGIPECKIEVRLPEIQAVLNPLESIVSYKRFPTDTKWFIGIDGSGIFVNPALLAAEVHTSAASPQPTPALSG